MFIKHCGFPINGFLIVNCKYSLGNSSLSVENMLEGYGICFSFIGQRRRLKIFFSKICDFLWLTEETFDFIIRN